MLDEIELPVVLMGDFNLEPNNEILSPLFDRLEDADKKSTNRNGFTFSSYNPYIKIDYILYSGLECTKTSTVKEIVSDHFPIIAEFN